VSPCADGSPVFQDVFPVVGYLFAFGVFDFALLLVSFLSVGLGVLLEFGLLFLTFASALVNCHHCHHSHFLDWLYYLQQHSPCTCSLSAF
jgi:hypothetical protein